MRILLAIKRSDLRLGMEMLLSEQTGFNVVGSITDTSSLLPLVKTTHPDIVVVEWDLPGGFLSDVLGSIQVTASRPAIIVMDKDAQTKQPAFAAGADAFVHKGDSPEELLNTIQRAYARNYPSSKIES